MVPKKSLLDEMKQEADELFGDEDGEDAEEEGGEQDYDDHEEERNEDEMEDELEEDEEETPRKSKGMRRLMGSKRKREPAIVENDDDFVCLCFPILCFLAPLHTISVHHSSYVLPIICTIKTLLVCFILYTPCLFYFAP